MFMVFNKEKISSYLVLLSTIVILFGLAVFFNKEDTVQTSSNIEKEYIRNNNLQIYINSEFEE